MPHRLYGVAGVRRHSRLLHGRLLAPSRSTGGAVLQGGAARTIQSLQCTTGAARIAALVGAAAVPPARVVGAMHLPVRRSIRSLSAP
jgi:hypothetical protein